MRPDPDSDLAGTASEYGDDTGFAAEATRVEPSTPAEAEVVGTDGNAPGSSGDDEPSGEPADTTTAAGPGDGAD